MAYAGDRGRYTPWIVEPCSSSWVSWPFCSHDRPRRPVRNDVPGPDAGPDRVVASVATHEEPRG
jgi:hypothetical protein